MFRSRAMSKVKLVIPKRDVIPVTEAVAAAGVFHVVKNPYRGIGEDEAAQTAGWESRTAAYTALERRILAIMAALGVDAGPPPDEAPHPIEANVAQQVIKRLEDQEEVPVHELEDERQHLEEIQHRIDRLTPLAGLNIRFEELKSSRYMVILPGTMPSTQIERLRTSLEGVLSVLVVLRQAEPFSSVVLFGRQRDAEVLHRAARSAYLNPLVPEETYRGTPAETIKALEAGLKRTQEHIANLEAEVRRLGQAQIKHLRLLLWQVWASRAVSDAIAQFGHLRHTCTAEGWVLQEQVSKLQNAVGSASKEAVVESMHPRLEEMSSVPVVLGNPGLLKSFQTLVTTYGWPNYVELDPTAVVTLTFPIIFGIMFGDVGHGLFVALLGILLSRVKPLKSLAGLAPVMIACGLAAAVFGALYGSVFGFEDIMAPLWLRPVTDTMTILPATVGVGVGILCLGNLFSIVNAAIAHKWGDMLFSPHGVTGLILYLTLLGAVGAVVGILPIRAPVFLAAAALAGLGIVLSKPLARWIDGNRPVLGQNIGSVLVESGFDLIEVLLSMLSNTLSYVRMGAFAVAHGALCMVIFILARLVSPGEGIGYWVVVVLGNLFVIGFEGMIVSIQTLRLEYYEFFSKFFSGTGIRHQPLRLIPKME